MNRARILIVDDEPGIRQSLAGVLEDEGFEARAVASGEACLAELEVNAYDAVLLDVWLPGIDGLEVLRKLEESGDPSRPMVVMISGHGSIEAAVRATKSGTFDFLEKPLTIEKVVVVVNNAIAQRRLRLEVRELRAAGRRVLWARG